MSSKSKKEKEKYYWWSYPPYQFFSNNNPICLDWANKVDWENNMTCHDWCRVSYKNNPVGNMNIKNPDADFPDYNPIAY